MNTEEQKQLLEDFAEYCHSFYTGCQKSDSDEWEYSYKNEVVFMIDGYLEDKQSKDESQ